MTLIAIELSVPVNVEVRVVQVVPLGPNQVTMQCPICKAEVRTATRKQPGCLAWLSCGIMAALG